MSGMGEPPNNDPNVVTIPVDPPAPPPPKTYSEAEVEAERRRVREEEAARQAQLDQRLAAMQTEVENLRSIQQSEEERRAAAAAQAAEEEAARRAAEEAELDSKDLVERRTAEFQQQMAEREQKWQSQLDQLQAGIAQRDALLEREREYQALMDYQAQRLAAVGDEIHPALRDLVTGTTPEEIEQSLQALIERSARILNEAAEAFGNQRRIAPGVAPTGGPPIGPMDLEPGTQQFTVDDLQQMPMSEYIKHRGRLLGAASNNRNRGLFG